MLVRFGRPPEICPQRWILQALDPLDQASAKKCTFSACADSVIASPTAAGL